MQRVEVVPWSTARTYFIGDSKMGHPSAQAPQSAAPHDEQAIAGPASIALEFQPFGVSAFQVLSSSS